MRLNAPSRISWTIALVLGLLSLLSYFVAIPFVTVNLFWIMGAGLRCSQQCPPAGLGQSIQIRQM